MSAILPNDVLQDEMAVFFARVMAAANREARQQGVDTGNSLITISQTEGGLAWRVNYGPKDYLNRRGGDLVVDVGAQDAIVRRVLHGQ
jgi:hypothetical protein